MADAEVLQDILEVLRSVDGRLSNLVVLASMGPKSSAPCIADDRDLDGKYGNPEVRFNPRDWTGESCKNRKMSECPAEFLDLLAETFDYFADQAEQSHELTTTGKPVAPYKRKDAARARGWAVRVRAHGQKTPSQAGPPGWADAPTDDDVPF
jgi:hypothetical protein